MSNEEDERDQIEEDGEEDLELEDESADDVRGGAGNLKLPYKGPDSLGG